MAICIKKEEFQKKVLESEIPVLVDFYSDTCVPCRRLLPILEELENLYKGKITIAKVNVREEAPLAGKYQVLVSPTVIFFQKGEEKGRIRGLDKLAVYKEKIDTLL